MKKTLFSLAMLFSVAINAQVKNNVRIAPVEPISHFKKQKYSDLRQTTMPLAQKTATYSSDWYNFLDYLEIVAPGLAVGDFMPVFPDSTIILGFTSAGDSVYPGYHKAANYLDPSFIGVPSMPNKTISYTIDSVYFGYAYERNSLPSVTDSVIVEVIGENHALDYTLTGPPSFPYQDIEYNYVTDKLKSTVPVLKRVAVALTATDTCSGALYKRIKLAVPGIPTQTNGKKIGTVISFKPGYTWNIHDTLIGGHSKNTFYILSVEQNGASTDPTVLGVPSDYTSNMNMSMILSTDSRYNISSTGWNGYLIPTYGYTAPFAYESHDIGYKLTVGTVGIKELEANGASLGQNVPNPFNGESTISYQLSKEVTSVLFTVTDVMGRVITSEKVATSIGTHSVKVASLAAGVYYYTLNVDGKTATKKMIVQ